MAMTNKKQAELEDKMRGALYGAAIGDAMGATTEFMQPKDISIRYGLVDNLIGGGWLNLQPGEVTDDTQMSMCIMRAAYEHRGIESGYCYEFRNAVIYEFIRWIDSNPKDVGKQCRSSIERLKAGSRSVLKTGNGLGNGSLMRAVPCALIANGTKYNLQQAALTHPDDLPMLKVRQYDWLVRQIIFFGKSLYELTEEAPLHFENNAFVVNTYDNAIHWARQGSFKYCIRGAVNAGGDADTIASVAGGLAGAEYGYKSIPKEWSARLDADVKAQLEEFLEWVLSYNSRNTQRRIRKPAEVI